MTKTMKERTLATPMLVVAAALIAATLTFSVNVSDERKAQNFARDGWLRGSIDNFIETLGVSR